MGTGCGRIGGRSVGSAGQLVVGHGHPMSGSGAPSGRLDHDLARPYPKGPAHLAAAGDVVAAGLDYEGPNRRSCPQKGAIA